MRAVALKCEVPAAHRYKRAIRADAQALHKLLSLDQHELSLVLTGDASIQKLNRTFRGQDRPTDVLSFPQFDNFTSAMPERGSGDCMAMPAALGDVVISVDTALRQAKRLGVTPEARLRTLLIHGVLHLLGYDHEQSPAEARRMFARERELAAILASGKKACGRRPAAVLPREIARHP